MNSARIKAPNYREIVDNLPGIRAVYFLRFAGGAIRAIRAIHGLPKKSTKFLCTACLLSPLAVMCVIAKCGRRGEWVG